MEHIIVDHIVAIAMVMEIVIHVIISARIHTAGRQVKFRTSQFLRCAITAKANVDYGQLFNELKNKKKEDKE